MRTFLFRPERFVLAAALVASLGLAGGAAVAAPKDAENFVRERGAEAIALLSRPGLTDQQYAQEFVAFVDRSFDVPAMAQFALGFYWRQANEAQRAEFVKLYKEYFINTYSQRFRQFSGERFDVLGVRAVNGTENLVQSRIVRPAAAAHIDIEWHVREQAGQQRVVDLIIEGLRLGITMRDEFGAIALRGGLDAVFTALRDKNLQFNRGV
jgi:phospholipid transport system substrate-binding protein